MKRVAAAVLACTMFATPVFAGLDKEHFLYKGGTLTDIPKEAEGPIDVSSSKEIVFPYTESDEKARQTGRFAIPYARINSLEYGEKSEFRVALAILVSPLALFAKRHLHLLTIGYKDPDGTQQVVVLQLGKDIVKTTLAILEQRTGQKVKSDSEDRGKDGDKDKDRDKDRDKAAAKPPAVAPRESEPPPAVAATAPHRAGVAPSGAAGAGETYYVNTGGEAYHRKGCKFIAAGAAAMPLDKAATARRPCKTCHPPLPATH